MKFCKVGIHKFKTIGLQTVSGIVGGFSEVQLHREVVKCKCGKIKKNGFDIATNAHLDESLNWRPII